MIVSWNPPTDHVRNCGSNLLPSMYEASLFWPLPSRDQNMAYSDSLPQLLVLVPHQFYSGVAGFPRRDLLLFDRGNCPCYGRTYHTQNRYSVAPHIPPSATCHPIRIRKSEVYSNQFQQQAEQIALLKQIPYYNQFWRLYQRFNPSAWGFSYGNNVRPFLIDESRQ